MVPDFQLNDTNFLNAEAFELYDYTQLFGNSVEDLPPVECLYLVFIRVPGESCRRRLGSLLCLCDVFRVLINTLVCLLFVW